MDIEQLIKQPELLDRETLFDLRSLVAMYPYYQVARLLMLQNLYLLHDPSFDEELRRAAIYIQDRRTIFKLIEAAHYRIHAQSTTDPKDERKDNASRTVALIDQFLDSLPETEQPEKKKQRKPTPADAAIDYVAYLLETEEETAHPAPQMKGQDLIDDFINKEGGKFDLKDSEILPPIDDNEQKEEKDTDEAYFTETLARIYIKQGRYSKALEIIKRLNLNYSKKNAYFADQIRFLEKLIINNNKK